MKHGLAEVCMNQVPVINLCYDKWGTQQLRALSQGLNCHVVVLENTIQAAFVSKLRLQLGHSHLDLLEAGHQAFQRLYPNSPNKPTITEACVALAKDFIHHINTEKAKHDKDLKNKIQALEKEVEIAKAKLKSTDSSEPGSPTSKKRDIEVPLSPGSKKPKFEFPPANAFTPGDDKPLQNNAPHDKGSREVTKWLDSIKKDMDKPAAAKLDNYITAVLKAHKDMPPADKPSAKDLAAHWGLPVVDAATYSDQLCLKLSAVAAFQVAMHSA